MDTCVDDILTHFSFIAKLPQLPNSMNLKLKAFQTVLRFVRMFLLCFPRLDYDANFLVNLTSLLTSAAEICKIEDAFFIDWDSVSAKMEDKIREFKAEIKKFREHLISCSLKAEPITGNVTMELLDSVNVNVNHLVKCQMDLDESFPVKISQIETLEEVVFLLRNLVYFVAYEESFGFEFNVHDCANKAACLTLLHWLNEMEDEEGLISLHIDLQQKVSPCNLDFIRFCFEVMKIPKLKHSDTLVFGEFVSRFVDFFLDNLMLILNDDVRMVHVQQGLILLITFLADPPANTVKHSELSFILKQICAVLDQASHTICYFGETNMDLAIGKASFDDFRKSIDEVKGEIEKIYVENPYSSWSNFPRINGLGYFESLLAYLENLKETMNKNKKLVPFLKHQIFTIHEELLPLRTFLQDVSTMQNKNEELRDIWEQIIGLSYQADLAIKSSFFIDHPIWYNITSLSYVVKKIKDIQYKVMNIEFKTRIEGKTEANPPLMSSVVVLQGPTSTSIVEVVVGFKHETEILLDRLESGTAQLDIVSIVGMGGIGKTTLAKKLFNERSIKNHFHKRAFCSISQEYKRRNVLLDILSDLFVIDDNVRQMSDDDLAHRLYKSLKGFKYLIVMDDIWDIDAWYDLKSSFPNDYNGSRVIFTTRINDISLIAKPDCTPYQLPFLSIDESWELLQQKIFHKDPCPPHLCEVGKLIAEKCQGLPLSIVVMAGLLARKERSLPQWNEVADTVSSSASSEGCMDIIKLSYKHLPEALKSCFLYLGVVSEDEIVEAKRLTLLWVAEGFVLKSGSSCLHKDAKKYLNDLGDRNLVTVTQRSTNGKIKRFQVHDLIRDFCRAEAQEEHYLCFINAHDTHSVCDQYRICIQTEWRSFVDAKPKNPNVHSLLYFSKAYREENSLQSFLGNFKLVQVLDLQEVEILSEFPTIVTTLVHLRHLALRLPTYIRIPLEEISNLWNLETLLLLSSQISRFPNDIWKMKRLRHVEIGYVADVDLGDVVTGVLSQLPNLETFTLLYIPPGEDGDELLRRLPNVRKLSCCVMGSWDPCRKCYQLPKLEILTKLESLKMMLAYDEVHDPCTLSFPLTIRKLILENLCVPGDEFSAKIGKMHCLQVLALYSISFIGQRWDVQDDEFPNIKSLTLHGLDIEEWIASIDSFPCLEQLTVSFCRRLIEIPPCFGEVPTLKSVSVKLCEKGVVDSAIQIQKDQLDSGNESLEVHLT